MIVNEPVVDKLAHIPALKVLMRHLGNCILGCSNSLHPCMSCHFCERQPSGAYQCSDIFCMVTRPDRPC